MLADVAEELEQRGIATINDGALCVFVPGFTNREGEPLPLIVRKQDGGYGYAATDLAAMRYRTQTLHGTRLLYVVGAPQTQHFAMVFAVGELAGWLAPPARAEHVAFGSILGTDKKMFKTRAGDTVSLAALLDEAIERADAEIAEHDPTLDRGRAPTCSRRRSGSAPSSTPTSRTIASRTTSSTGTGCSRSRAGRGPYLQYAHARIRSIFRKATETGVAAATAQAPIALARARGARACARAARLRRRGARVGGHAAAAPARRISTISRRRSRRSSRSAPCSAPPDDTTRESRLTLCALTARVLARGLGLLGIEAPERM